jgi:hypothetical protein
MRHYASERAAAQKQQFQVSAYGKLNCKHAGPVGGKKSSLKARRREIARFSSRRHPGCMGGGPFCVNTLTKLLGNFSGLLVRL